MAKLDIVIVNWNTGAQLQACLQSLASACLGSSLSEFRCIVVDNDSADGSTDGLEGLPFPLQMIRNNENKGFAYACNQGAGQGNSEYILFLNPDCRLFPDSLEKVSHFLKEQGHEHIGIIGVQLVDGNGAIQRNVARFPTPKSLMQQMLGLDRLLPRRFPPHFITDWDYRENREIDQVPGAFFFVRRKVFEQLNGFDERFFMYYEDLDFSYRAMQAGWKSFYLADAQAVHYGGGASYQVKGKRLYYVLMSRALYVAKHFGFQSSLRVIYVSWAVEFWARIGWSFANQSENNFFETVQAYRMYLQTLPKLLKDIRGQ